MADEEGTPSGHVVSKGSGRQADASASSDSSLEVHLGPWTAPASPEQDPSLLDFALAIKKLIRVAAGHDTWWRFEYLCFGNPVPILSDNALHEAFNYFRDQTQALSPAAAAEACRLYLKPTTQPPPWTLQDYLSEPRLGFGLQQTPTPAASGVLNLGSGSQMPLCHNSNQPNHHPLNRTYSRTWSEQGLLGADTGPSIAAGAAAALPAAAAAAASNGDGGASSSSSSHELPQQQQQQQHLLLHQAAADSSLQLPSSGAQVLLAAGAAAALPLPGVLSVLDQGFFSRRQCQQQQQGTDVQTDLQQYGQVQHDLATEVDNQDVRSSKMAKRNSDSSPRAQWQHEQQQQQNTHEQQIAEPETSGVSAFPSPFAAVPAAAATPAVHQQQLQPQQILYSIAPNRQQGPIPPAAAAAGGGSSADNSGELPLVGSFTSLDQLQLLHLSSGNLSNLAGVTSSNLPAGLNSMALAGSLGLLQSTAVGDALSTQQQQQQQLWNILSKQQKQQAAQMIAAAATTLNQQPISLSNVKAGDGPLGQPILDRGAQGAGAGIAAAAATAAAAGSTLSGDATPPDLQLAVAASRAKSETKTKYADGRFKDEARHQQRLSDMKNRCDALFGGAIQQHFQIEHHKRVTCLVCNSTVVPYEAYHIDAVRKHFVRHHEAWLITAGVDVDLWRKSCAPIAKAAGAAAAAGARGPAAAAAGSSEAGAAAAAAAVGDDDLANARKASSTRLPDGRYRDPQQHQQRLLDMQNRCAGLFGGTMTQHWSILSHKSISCHLCQQNITPYAAYHPDCLRKHFVRRHEDVLTAAGVDVAAWSKGIPLGRRKLKAMLQQQQSLVQPQQQQGVLALQQQQALLGAGLQQQHQRLVQQQQQHASCVQQQLQGELQLEADQAPLLPAGSQQQGQQGHVMPLLGPQPLLSWLNAAQLQQQQKQQQSRHSRVANASFSTAMTAAPMSIGLGAVLEQQQPQQLQLRPQQQQQQLAAVAFAGPSLAPQHPPSVRPPIATVHFAAADTAALPLTAEPATAQQQALVSGSTGSDAAATLDAAAAAASAAWQPPASIAYSVTVAQLPNHDAAVPEAAATALRPRQPHTTLQLPAQHLAPQQLAPQQLPGQQLPPQQVPAQQLPAQPHRMPAQQLAPQQSSPQQLSAQQVPPQQVPPQQLPSQQATLTGTGTLEMHLGLHTGRVPVSQPAAQQQQQLSASEWACSLPDAPGFGPMSLSPAMGLAGLANSLNGGLPNSLQGGMGGSMMDVNMLQIGSLTEADVAAMWADDDDIACEYDDLGHLDSTALADELLKQASSLWAAEHR